MAASAADGYHVDETSSSSSPTAAADFPWPCDFAPAERGDVDGGDNGDRSNCRHDDDDDRRGFDPFSADDRQHQQKRSADAAAAALSTPQQRASQPHRQLLPRQCPGAAARPSPMSPSRALFPTSRRDTPPRGGGGGAAAVSDIGGGGGDAPSRSSSAGAARKKRMARYRGGRLGASVSSSSSAGPAASTSAATEGLGLSSSSSVSAAADRLGEDQEDVAAIQSNSEATAPVPAAAASPSRPTPAIPPPTEREATASSSRRARGRHRLKSRKGKGKGRTPSLIRNGLGRRAGGGSSGGGGGGAVTGNRNSVKWNEEVEELIFLPDEKSCTSSSSASCYSDEYDSDFSLSDASCSSASLSWGSGERRQGSGGGGETRRRDRFPPSAQSASASTPDLDEDGTPRSKAASGDGQDRGGQSGIVVRMANAVGVGSIVGEILTIEKQSEEAATDKGESGSAREMPKRAQEVQKESKEQHTRHSTTPKGDADAGDGWTTFEQSAFPPSSAFSGRAPESNHRGEGAPSLIDDDSADEERPSSPDGASADAFTGISVGLDDDDDDDDERSRSAEQDARHAARLADRSEASSPSTWTSFDASTNTSVSGARRHRDEDENEDEDEDESTVAAGGAEGVLFQLSSAVQRAADEVSGVLESVDLSVLAPSELAKNFSLKEWELDSLMGVLSEEMDRAPVRGYLDVVHAAAPPSSSSDEQKAAGRTRRRRR